MAATMELITISRMKAARRCFRFHYYDYELGRRPIKTSEALFFGSLFHAGLEQWWLTWKEIHDGEMDRGNGTRPLSIAIAAMRRFFEGAPEDSADPFLLVKAEELMRGYHYRWADDMEIITVIAVESQFIMPMVNPLTGRESKTYKLGGKIDVRIRMQCGTCRTVEHKSSTEDIQPGAIYWTRLRMDGQVSQYQDGAVSLGDDTIGCLYDVARRPTQLQRMMTPVEEQTFTKPKSCGPCRDIAQAKAKAAGLKKLLVADIPCTDGCPTCEPPRLYANQRAADETLEEFRARVSESIAEDPERYFQRADVVRLEDELVEFRFDTWRLSKGIREAQLAARTLGKLAWPRNTDNCWKWSRACEYLGVCEGREDITDDHLFIDKDGQHSELDLDAG